MNACVFGHTWGRWEEYEREFRLVTTLRTGREEGLTAEIWQRRSCRLCGFTERKLVAVGPGHK